MGWNTACVHRLAGFEKAKAWHDQVKPIRGHKNNVRPYGSRRHHVMASIHMPDDNTVRLEYYGHTLVEWRSDNTYSVYPPKYASAYVPDNIVYYLPLSGQSFEWSRGRLFYVQGNEWYQMPRGGESLEFQFVDGKSFLLNAPVAYNYKARRNALDKILPQYEAFMSWAQVVLSVAEFYAEDELQSSFDRFATDLGYLSKEEYADVWKDNITPEERDEIWDERYQREALPFGFGYNDWRRGLGYNDASCKRVQQMMLNGSPDDWVQVLHIAAYQGGTLVWRPSTGKKFSAEMCLHWVKMLMSYVHRDEVFDRVRLPKGTKPSKTNTKFFRDSTFIPRKLRHVVDKSI